MAKHKKDSQVNDNVVTKPDVEQKATDTILHGDQIIIGTGGILEVGKEYKVSANVAMAIINKGHAVLK